MTYRIDHISSLKMLATPFQVIREKHEGSSAVHVLHRATIVVDFKWRPRDEVRIAPDFDRRDKVSAANMNGNDFAKPLP
jgi:peroxiredoxin